MISENGVIIKPMSRSDHVSHAGGEHQVKTCAHCLDAGAAAGRHQLPIGARGSFRCADHQLLLTSPDPATPD